MAGNFPSLMKDININIPDAQGIPSKIKLKETNTKTLTQTFIGQRKRI